MLRGLISFSVLLLACGPGTDTSTGTDDGSTTASTNPASSADSTGSAGSDTSADTSAGPTSAPTTGADASTGDLTTAGPTTAGPSTTDDPSTTSAPDTTDTTDTATTGGSIECDPFPVEGEPCDVEGASCNTGCENQCEFCNILFCEQGVWTHLEAPPAPCLSCEEICPFTLEPMCNGGPPDQGACVAGCQDALAGRCEGPFSNMLVCAGFMPAFECNADDLPSIAGCETQFADLYACLGLP